MVDSAKNGAPKAMQAPTLRPGQLIARRYQIVKMVGRGGMGAIYQAQDNVLRETVALKTLLPQFAKDQTIVQRFFNEARIARQLSHPNVVRVHDIGMADQILYISMEYVEGRSLRSLFEAMPKGSPYPAQNALDVAKQVCHALDYAHRYTIHRDIKPENIMVTAQGVVKLMDFGISKLTAAPGLTQTSMIMGTPQYMPPEQFQDSASVDARADLYSLGVILYEAMTRRLPTGMSRPVSEVNPQVPKALDDIIGRCLAPEKEDRFPSAAALGSALEAVQRSITGGPQPARPAGHLQTRMPTRGQARRLTGAALALVLFAASLASAGILLRNTGDAEPPPAQGMKGELEHAALRAAVETMRQKAAAYAEGDPAKAELLDRADEFIRNGRLLPALECYMGVALWPTDDSMVFVPPGEAAVAEGGASALFQVGGFFADRREVSEKDFTRFAFGLPGHWAAPGYLQAVPPGEAAEDRPVVSLPLYYAQAFAAGFAQAFSGEYGQSFGLWGERGAAAGKQIPTEAQWVRMAAFARETGVDLLHIGGEAAEWTCTRYGPLPYSAADGRSKPSSLGFGAPVVYRGDSQGVDPYTSRRSMPFEGGGNRLGFRCVKALPGPAELLRLAQRIPETPPQTE